MSVEASPLAPAIPVSGTRKRLDHIDAMRPVKQFGVVSTHTLIFFAAVGTGVTVGCVATAPARDPRGVPLHFCLHDRLQLPGRAADGPAHLLAQAVQRGRRALPVLDAHLLPRHAARDHGFAAMRGSIIWPTSCGTGYYQLYFLVVLLEFYVVFPLLLILLRRTVGHHGLLLAVSAALQVLIVSLMHWGVLPHWMRGFWATREVTSYQFYLIAGMVVAFHLEEVHRWLCSHVRLVLGATLASAALAEAWYYLAVYHVVSWFGSSSDPFQPIVIPWNIGAIASIYLLGVWLVSRRRSTRTRALTKTGSDDSYGVYLAQLVFITGTRVGRMAPSECVRAVADRLPVHGRDRLLRLCGLDRGAWPGPRWPSPSPDARGCRVVNGPRALRARDRGTPNRHGRAVWARTSSSVRAVPHAQARQGFDTSSLMASLMSR